MLIINTQYTPQNINNKDHLKKKYSYSNSNTVCFNGYIGKEKFEKVGIKYLNHETGLFRDFQTLKFIKQYIEKNLTHKEKINIVSGACATGEEAISLSIILNDLKDKVHILGIDLSENTIKQAQSRKFIFQRIKNYPKWFNPDDYYMGLKDRFLVYGTNRELSKDEKFQKKLFEQFFDVPIEKVDKKRKIPQVLQKIIDTVAIIFRPNIVEEKTVKLKADKINNCTFKVGNIEDINTLTNGEKSDIILFKNAIYHLITEDIGENLLRVLQKNGEEIAENLILKLKNNLNKDGLICFGEDEDYQMSGYEIIPKIMKRLGFNPLNKTEEHEANVWRKLD
jgi:chemotaxis methyl-accepting protein methylase